jgi:hypothetical protein
MRFIVLVRTLNFSLFAILFIDSMEFSNIYLTAGYNNIIETYTFFLNLLRHQQQRFLACIQLK